ncbi:uncharacterized protein LOC136075172 [Hydra vulgaris]|uniref:Uncharacterized protein LOC136075172 n=1 Tax=Hydra vulgaris TaxID=6087 RepID=A0ABM4B492_HYDVU
MKTNVKQTFDKFDFEDEDSRHDIYSWSERRQKKRKGLWKSFNQFRVFAFDLNLIQSFFSNFNIMVLLQMALAGLITYACKSFDIEYDINVTLFVSPIVFPLAFSINTDFQRREKVLEDLALFKSSSMMWFFCLRDWREACELDDAFMKTVRNKLKCLLFHLREYLLTEKLDRRQFILRVIYEDLSDANQLNEKVRASPMPANSPLVSNMVALLNIMCLSFEKLRVIREYRSPRSIRSFTKVLIFVIPLILSPYYVHIGVNVEQKDVNNWSPYYISLMVAFVFGVLQGVQDKLDDPFDGMSEDDINLDTLDEWTSQSLEATVHRTYQVGRFQVSKESPRANHVALAINLEDHNLKRKKISLFNRFGAKYSKRDRSQPRSALSNESNPIDDLKSQHPYADVLNNIQGNTTIKRGEHSKSTEKNYLQNSVSVSTGIPQVSHVFSTCPSMNVITASQLPTVASESDISDSPIDKSLPNVNAQSNDLLSDITSVKENKNSVRFCVNNLTEDLNESFCNKHAFEMEYVLLKASEIKNDVTMNKNDLSPKEKDVSLENTKPKTIQPTNSRFKVNKGVVKNEQVNIDVSEISEKDVLKTNSASTVPDTIVENYSQSFKNIVEKDAIETVSSSLSTKDYTVISNAHLADKEIFI